MKISSVFSDYYLDKWSNVCLPIFMIFWMFNSHLRNQLMRCAVVKHVSLVVHERYLVVGKQARKKGF